MAALDRGLWVARHRNLGTLLTHGGRLVVADSKEELANTMEKVDRLWRWILEPLRPEDSGVGAPLHVDEFYRQVNR